MDEAMVNNLVGLIERGLRDSSGRSRPALRLVHPSPVVDTGMDPVTRESHLRMIRQLRRAYRQFGFDLLVAQATMGKTGVEALNDDELVGLHRDLDRARECLNDGVTFEEAGLLRSCPDV